MRKKYKHDVSDNLCGTLFSPESDWRPPAKFPDLRGERVIAIDAETRDPDLTTKGPGFIRKDARAVGFSVATIDHAWYFPIGHLGGGNLSPDNVTAYLRDVLANADGFMVGANLQYDLEALWSLGITPMRRTIDVQIAEALIDEEQESYSLESIARKYLNRGKDEALLREAASAYGVDPKGGLWKLHSKYVGPYAEWDAMATIQIFNEQLKILREEETEDVFKLECDLLPLLWQMRLQGIPVDLEAATKLSAQLLSAENDLRLKLRDLTGMHINEWSGGEIAVACDKFGILFPRTAHGAPSFTADYLDEADHELLILINDLREVNGFRKKFVDGWIHANEVKGRIHPQWKQCASDTGGTRTGRMAASNPNPQQVPAGKYRKTGKPSPIGQSIRACFISDTGTWGKLDYSQQEPRILTHFAAVCDFTGAKFARMAYQNNKLMDFYNFMVEAAGIDRRPAKDMYLGRCYGMGRAKLALKLNKPIEEAERILAIFDEKVPFVKEIADSCNKNAARRGYIRTLLGRRRHFNFWEPINSYELRQKGKDTTPMRHDLAEKKWPGLKLQRSNTHKALNALIQGSAADMTKAALLAIWKEGKVVPYMQVHDEIDFAANDQAHAELCQRLAESCVEMTVPIRADLSVGRTWK